MFAPLLHMTSENPKTGFSPTTDRENPKNQQNPNGALVWLESPIHVSKVMKAEKYDARKANKR